MSDTEYTPPTYYMLNKEKLQARKKLWVQKNYQKVLDANKRYRERNRQKLNDANKEYRRVGAYKCKLIQRFNIIKGEILLDNVSNEIIQEFSELIDEMYKMKILDDEEYETLKNYI